MAGFSPFLITAYNSFIIDAIASNFPTYFILHSASRSIPIALSCAANLSALAFSPSARRSACSALSRSCSALSRSCSIRSLPQNSKGSSVCAMQWTGLLGMKLL